MSSKETFQTLDPCMVAYSKLTLMLSLEKQSLPKSRFQQCSAQTVSPKQSFPYFTQCKATLCSFRFSQEAFFSSFMAYPSPLQPPPLTSLSVRKVSSPLIYYPLLPTGQQCNTPMLPFPCSLHPSTTQNAPVHQCVPFSQPPNVSGCCMPVSSQNLANTGSSLCLSLSLSFSLCMWLCLLWLIRA